VLTNRLSRRNRKRPEFSFPHAYYLFFLHALSIWNSDRVSAHIGDGVSASPFVRRSLLLPGYRIESKSRWSCFSVAIRGV